MARIKQIAKRFTGAATMTPTEQPDTNAADLFRQMKKPRRYSRLSDADLIRELTKRQKKPEPPIRKFPVMRARKPNYIYLPEEFLVRKIAEVFKNKSDLRFENGEAIDLLISEFKGSLYEWLDETELWDDEDDETEFSD